MTESEERERQMRELLDASREMRHDIGEMARKIGAYIDTLDQVLSDRAKPVRGHGPTAAQP